MINLKNLTKKAFVVLVLFAFLFYQGRGENIYFRTIPAEAGLSQLTVSCIFQDSKGFLWFGTRNGLNRYDGYNFEVFRTNNSDSSSISNNSIISITEDSQGNLWIATDHGLNCYDYSTNKFIRYLKSNENNGISHNKIGSLYYDRKGRLWIGTEQGLDLFNPRKKTFHKSTFNKILFNNRILSVSGDSYGNIWIGTLNTGIIQYNPETGKYKVFLKTSREKSLPDNTVRTIFEDSDRNLWVGTKRGLCVYEPKSGTFKLFGRDIYFGEKLSNEGIRCITEDHEKNLLIGTNEGYNILNKETGDLHIYSPTSKEKGSLNHYYIYSIFVDKAETVWLGTFSGGINYYYKADQQFQFSSPGITGQIVDGGVGPMAEEGKNLWIGTNGGGLFCYDKLTKTYSRYLVENTSMVTNVINALLIQGNNLYITTGDSKLVTFDLKSRRISRTVNVSRNQIINIYREDEGKLLLCVRDSMGLRKYNPATGEIEPYTYKYQNGKEMLFPYATCLEKENDSIYWIGTRYVGFYRYNKNTNTAIRFNKTNLPALPSNNISVLSSDSRNNLWIGADGGGIWEYNKNTGKFKIYGEQEGLSNETIQGILHDDSGMIWISTLSGISRLDPVTGKFKNYSYSNGFPIQEPSVNSFIRLSDGRLCFGGNNGMVIFNSHKILSNSYIPPVIITNFNLLRPELKKSDLLVQKKFVADGSSIRLRHNQSSFIIQFTALNYIFPDKNQYAYQLEGFDKGWNQVGHQRIAIYTNLHAGTYRFMLKASNNDGLWNEHYTTLNIIVMPPFWLSWYAYILYILIFAGLTYWLLSYLKLQNKIRLTELEQENLKKVHQLRIRMFTNFSHELRTPLTLMIGPLEDLLNRAGIGQTIRQPLTMIQKNAQRLLMITNQLMDFRKQESGKMQLRATEGNFSDYMKEISLAFSELARKQNIRYTFHSGKKEIMLWYDHQLLEKVFFNLLSNAFKNTSSGGEIEIKLNVKSREEVKNENQIKAIGEYVEISIRDTGKGISRENLAKIFDPFYQVCDSNHAPTVGTGIGLSLTKGIVELHSGMIRVESEPGKGSDFRVFLPLGKSHLHEDEIVTSPGEGQIPSMILPAFDPESEDEINVDIDHELPTILIVEDNAEVRGYIRKCLRDSYHILEAENGETGLSKAISQIPDLILSDVMMPGMNGLELCYTLKNELNTCHIPIVLLTALTTFSQIKEGFEVGADDYILKPFNSELLKLKVHNLIMNRERLKKAFSKKFPFGTVNAETSSFDNQFLEKIYTIIDKNLSDSEFDLDAFSEEIGMSRANLYRKVKALTNFAPNELLKNYRMKAALKLLLENKHSVSEISYMVGFSTPAYFSNCFKKTYQLSPSEYLEKHQGKNE